MKARKYVEGDSRNLKLKSFYGDDETIHERIEGMAHNSHSYLYTLLVDDTPVAIIGGMLMLPGVVELWALTSDEIDKHPKEFYKACLKTLLWAEENLKPHRFQMMIKSDQPKLHKWAQKLGMTPEGTMRQYGYDKSDFTLYARIR